MSGSAFLFLASLSSNLLSFSLILSLKTYWFALITAIIGLVLLYFFDVNKSALLIQFDVSIFLLLLTFLIETNPKYSIIGSVLAFLGNFIYNRKNSLLLSSGIISASALSIFLFSKYLAKDFGTALVKTSNFILNVITWILKRIWAFFVWLSSLFPNPEVEETTEYENAFKYEMEIEERLPPSKIASLIVAIIISILLLYLLILFIKYMIESRKSRVKIERLQANSVTKKKRKLFDFGLRYKRGTILWRYNKIKKKLKFTPSHKKKYETPSEFLKRTEEQGIAEMVNIALYANNGKSNDLS